MYRWRAVDDEGEVLDILVQRHRNKHAALRCCQSNGNLSPLGVARAGAGLALGHDRPPLSQGG
jgi:hypothetical protein